MALLKWFLRSVTKNDFWDTHIKIVRICVVKMKSYCVPHKCTKCSDVMMSNLCTGDKKIRSYENK